jgi:hypothetical protein
MGGRIPQRRPSGCAVCGSHEIERDEVLDASVLGLAECTRCRHRWTERPLLHAAAAAESADEEVAAAA